MLEAPVHHRRPSNSLLHHPYPQDWTFRSNTQPIFNNSSFQIRNNDQYKLYNTELPTDFNLFDLSQSNDNLRSLRLSAQTPEGSIRGEGSMQSDSSVAPSSFTYGQLTPNSARTHHRESSLSSLGSTGPASPYNQTTSHPQVALSDSITGDTFYDGLPSYNNNNNNNNSSSQFGKALTPSRAPAQDFSFGYSNYNLQPYQESNIAADMMATQRPAMDNSMLAAASDYNHMPKQVANMNESSTPRSVELDRRSKIDLNRTIIPKLDRTMTDVYQDELFNPSFTITSAPSTTVQTTSNSPHQDVFTQRLQAAKSQHLRASQSPTMPSQDRTSPFREGSQYAPRIHEYESSLRLGSAAQMREQQKAINDAREIREQIQKASPQQTTPKTISPQEAFLDYQPQDEEATMPLFPSGQTQYTAVPRIAQAPSQPEYEEPSLSQQSFASMATSRRGSSSAYSTSSNSAPQANFNFAPPSIPGNYPTHQSYYLPNSRRVPTTIKQERSPVPDFPSSLTSMESSTSEYTPEQHIEIKKPARTMADGGTYTCTYHGCTLRFETPAKLQKHKREIHRQSAPLLGAGQRGSEPAVQGMTSAALTRNSQAGPHKCERINPSTGKPCNTIFSRPYDLTRHEDTIHNSNKQKVRCHLCTEEKKFSRNDAFTRHMRVVHPEVDFPQKTRRRGHN